MRTVVLYISETSAILLRHLLQTMRVLQDLEDHLTFHQKASGGYLNHYLSTDYPNLFGTRINRPGRRGEYARPQPCCLQKAWLGDLGTVTIGS